MNEHARTSFARRVLGAALLDRDVYEEVEADRTALGQAALVVTASAVAAGVGSFANGGVWGLVAGTVAAWLGWIVWAYVTSFIGVRLLPGPDTQSDAGELLRTLGFSAAPGLLRVAGVVPEWAPWVYYGCALWMLTTMVVAVRQALDYQTTGRALLVCAVGFPVYLAFLVVSLLLTGPWPI